MKISELKPGQGNVNIDAEVVDKGNIRAFDKFGKQGKVCNAIIKDDSGKVSLTLWNEQVDQINVGNKIKITNGYCSEYKGEIQLSPGKFGKLEVIDMSSKDHGEHILTEDEVEESKDLEKELPEPEPEEEVTEDEMEEADLAEPKTEEPDDDDIDIEEENVE